MNKIISEIKDDVFETVTHKIEKMIKKERKGKKQYDKTDFNKLYLLLLENEIDPICLSLVNSMIASYMMQRTQNKLDKMEKDESKGKRVYSIEEYDEVYAQMPVFIEYDEEEGDGDGYWDLNL